MKLLLSFNIVYLVVGGYWFLQKDNLEFIIYVGVIIGLLALLYVVHRQVQFPSWMLWGFSLWGLLHVLGGAVIVDDQMLFAYRIYPFIDLGGEFYILKYDQVVHSYLYGLLGTMALYLLRKKLPSTALPILATWAVLISLGISGLNEIVEFIISLNMENGVGGYYNTMLDMCFNLAGAVIAVGLYVWYAERTS